MRRAATALVGVLGIALAACGSPDDDLPSGAPVESLASVPTAPTDVTSAPSSVATASTEPPAVAPDPFAGVEPCPTSDTATEATLAEAQFAFVGSVRDVAAEIHPWTTDPENPEHSDDPGPLAWVTFDVERWYTNDWGSTFSVWMPRHRLEPSARAAVGGNAYFTQVGEFAGQSGEVELCVALAADAPTPAAWDDHFGGSVEPGVGAPEGDPDPATVAALEAARDEWHQRALSSYSYLLAAYDSRDTTWTCGRSGELRIVVSNGEPVEAVGTADGCTVDPGSVPSVDDVFARAIELAGASDFTYDVDPAGAAPVSFGAYDRSVDVFMGVRHLSSDTSAAVGGWADVTAAARDARARWQAADPDYAISIRTGGGERMQFDVDARVLDGEVVELAVNGTPADPADFGEPWQPITVDDLFDLVAEMEGGDNVVAVFDVATGAPLALWFDPSLNSIDEELTVLATVTPE